MLEKDNSGDEFVRLRLPVIDKRWNPTHQTLLAAYNELMQIINRPPIICEKNAPKVRKVNQRKIERKLTLENSEIKGIIENLESEAEKTLIAKNQLLDSELKLDYLICREKFLSEHLPNVKNAIEMKSWEVASTIEDLK